MYPNIKAEMARIGYTREKLAIELNITLPTLRKKINGDVPFKMNEIEKLLSLFGRELTFEYLFQKN